MTRLDEIRARIEALAANHDDGWPYIQAEREFERNAHQDVRILLAVADAARAIPRPDFRRGVAASTFAAWEAFLKTLAALDEPSERTNTTP